MASTVSGSDASSQPRTSPVVVRSDSVSHACVGTPVFQWILAWVLLIPLLYLLLEGITAFQASGSSGYGGLEQDQAFLQAGRVSIVARLITIAVWTICAFGIVTRFSQVVTLAWEMKTISALSLLTMISCIWSQDPALTLLKSILFIAGTLFAYYLAERLDPDELMQLFLMLGSLVLVVTIVMSVALPQYGVDITGAWRGLFNHKNKLSRAVLLMLPPVLALRLSGMLHIGRVFYVATTIGVIIMTQSRTVWIITVAFFVFSFGLHAFSRMRKQDAFTLVLIGWGFLGCLGYLVFNNFAILTQMLGKDSTLSGRTDIWRAVLESGFKQPLLGFGFGAFWRGVQGESINVFLSTGYALWQGHNSYLDIWLDLGLLGLGLFFITFVNACRDGYVCLQPGCPREVHWYLNTIFIIISLGITQGQLLMHNSLVILLYFISCIGLRKVRRQMMLQRTVAHAGHGTLKEPGKDAALGST